MRLYWFILIIYLYSAVIELHYNDIYKSLEELHEKKLKATGRKCEFAVTKVEYFGHIVKNGTVAMDPERIRVVVDYPLNIPVRQL